MRSPSDRTAQVGIFLAQRCRIGDPQDWTATADLYATYLEWARAMGIRRTLSRSAFTVVLGQVRGIEPHQYGRGRGWEGLVVLDLPPAELSLLRRLPIPCTVTGT